MKRAKDGECTCEDPICALKNRILEKIDVDDVYKRFATAIKELERELSSEYDELMKSDPSEEQVYAVAFKELWVTIVSNAVTGIMMTGGASREDVVTGVMAAYDAIEHHTLKKVVAAMGSEFNQPENSDEHSN